MSKKNRIMWDEKVRERMLTDIVKKLIEDNHSVEAIESMAKSIKTAIENFHVKDSEPSRLSQVLESYRLHGGQAIHIKAINLAQMVAINLPGERFWLVSPTADKGVMFESELATVEVLIKKDGDDVEVK